MFTARYGLNVQLPFRLKLVFPLISPVLFSLYVNDIPSPSHHVELALYADDTAIIATSRKPTLLVSYLESYLNDLQRWLIEWRIAKSL